MEWYGTPIPRHHVDEKDCLESGPNSSTRMRSPAPGFPRSDVSEHRSARCMLAIWYPQLSTEAYRWDATCHELARAARCLSSDAGRCHPSQSFFSAVHLA